MFESLGESIGSPGGYALLTVVVFAFVLVVAGFAFYELVFMETKGALYRQDSSESFLLADGAVERARAKFLEDRSWRDGWLSESAGRGEYDLTVRDTVYDGVEAVRLLASGRVGAAERRIEVFIDLPPTGYELPLLVMGDADASGNVCLEGNVHVNGDADFGPNAVHLKCGGDLTSGFEILPPPMYTDPDYFPDATYYYVEGSQDGGVTHGKIYNENFEDITPPLPGGLVDPVSWNAADSTYTFEFKGDAADYFDDTSGLFARAEGDQAVVVNFGQNILNPGTIRSNIFFQDDEASIHATVINTRFTGVTVSDRLDEQYWFGGLTSLRNVTFEPYYGVALVVADLAKPGNALVELGTESYPALIYVTKSVVDMNSNLDMVGSFLVLGDWQNQGGPDLTYDEAFMDTMPDELLEGWPVPVSGTMEILRWREVAAAAD